MGAPSANMVRVAAGVAADLAAGEGLDAAIERASVMLGVSREAVVVCVGRVAVWMNDPCLESPEGWGS